MSQQILFETSRFIASEPNDPSGQELLRWLSEELAAHGAVTNDIRRKSPGWELDATHGVAKYVVIASRQSGDSWKIQVDKRRTMSDQLLGKNKLVPTDPFVWLVENALQNDSAIKNVRRT
jgi:hypothetical protein